MALVSVLRVTVMAVDSAMFARHVKTLKNVRDAKVRALLKINHPEHNKEF